MSWSTRSGKRSWWPNCASPRRRLLGRTRQLRRRTWPSPIRTTSRMCGGSPTFCCVAPKTTLSESVTRSKRAMAWRRCASWWSYEHQTPGTKRALLKAIINNPASKKPDELEKNLMKVEEYMKHYAVMAGADLPEDLKVTVIINLCTKDLKEHLELSTVRWPTNRDEIISYAERTVITRQVQTWGNHRHHR